MISVRRPRDRCREAARVGLKLNAGKCKTLRTEHAQSKERIVVNGEQVEDVNEFAYVDKESTLTRKVEAVETLGIDCKRRKVHSEDYGKCGQLEEGEPRYAFSRH